MEQMNSSSQTTGEISSSLFDRIKRAVTGIGAFMDLSGYKKEIARYEDELRRKNG